MSADLSKLWLDGLNVTCVVIWLTTILRLLSRIGMGMNVLVIWRSLMNDVVNVAEVELNSSCVCEYYDEFDQLQPSDDCFGCFDDALVDLEHLILLPWLKDHDADNGDYVVASGSNVGWQRLSGEVSFEVDYDDIVDDLVGWFSLNGEFRLTFKLADGELTVRRGSHDEPMGAYFDLRIVKREEDAE